MSNVYEKILQARTKFAKENIKKSGRNKFQNFDYYELNDIVPPALKICEELKLYTHVSITKENAIMNVIDLENDGGVAEFSIALPEFPISTNFNNAIQDVGKMETYLRRYLYLLFLDIVEPDLTDSANTEKINESEKPVANKKQFKPSNNVKKPSNNRPVNNVKKPINNKPVNNKPVNSPIKPEKVEDVLSDKKLQEIKQNILIKNCIENIEVLDPDITKQKIINEIDNLLQKGEITENEKNHAKRFVQNF